MIYSLNCAEASDIFPVARTSTEVLKYLENIKENSIIFIDIDDTIITPSSTTFRAPPYNKLLDDIKKHKDQYKNYEEIVSNWRLQRKIMLIDQNWPDILDHLKHKHRVYGLTKMDNGRFGNINSMEEWRYDELKSLRVEFSNDYVIHKPINNASFYKGFLMTGSNSKSKTVAQYMEHFNSDLFVLIDDREEHLHDMSKFCAERSIKFIGILFSGLEAFQDMPNPKIAALQKKYLIEHAKWLEDSEAEKMIQDQKK